jgi:two-component system sensor histidine kinase VicK
MERQSGYSKTELLSQNPRILGSNQVPKGNFSDMWQELSNQKRWVGELVNQHKDGHTYDVAVTITPIINSEGEVTGYVSVQSDITRLKEVERLKTEFIANVSHQLRTPLTNIKTYVSLLKKGKPEHFPRYFSVLHHEIDRLARLIQDLLDISRLDAEAAPSREVATDFYDFWELFWPPFTERAERANRRLNVMLSKQVKQGTLTVSMESYQLDKVLSRLLENALTYSNEGGEIEVIIAEKGQPSWLEIKVRDEGPGIPEAERPFIFNRFFRGAATIEAGLPGNGLGLAIVKELLNRYGGNISLESEVGVGSCFTLQLPLAPPSVNLDGQHDVT